MSHFLRLLTRPLRRYEKGASATEYAVLLSLVVLILLAVITLFGERLTVVWNNVALVLAGI